jgi:hypothetical protein
VRDDRESLLGLLVEIAHQLYDPTGVQGIEFSGRLIGEDQHGGRNERPRYGDPLALAAR